MNVSIGAVWSQGLMITGTPHHVRVLRTDAEARAVDSLLAEMRGGVTAHHVQAARA